MINLLPKLQEFGNHKSVRCLTAAANRLLHSAGPWIVRIKGQSIYAHSVDRFLALWMHRLGRCEDFEMRLWLSLCEPGMTVIDIGSNMGLFASLAASRVGSHGHIFAFEADPECAEMCRKTAAANGHDNLTVIAKAVGDKLGTAHFGIREEHRGDGQISHTPDGRRVIKVPLTTIDHELVSVPTADVIKMDIQGAEVLAFNGMLSLISRSPRLVVLSELWPDGLAKFAGTVTTYLEGWGRAGFSASYIDSQTQSLVPMDACELQKLCSRKHYVNILLARDLQAIEHIVTSIKPSA